jgi:type IV secretion system protein VirB6
MTTLTPLPMPDADDLLFLDGFATDLAIVKVAILSYSAAVIEELHFHIVGLLILFVIFWGFALMRGVVDHPGRDAYWRFLKMVFVVMIALGHGSNVIYIADVVWELPDEMVHAFTPLLNTSAFESINALLSSWGELSVELLAVGVMSYVAGFAQDLASPDADASQLVASSGMYIIGGGLSGAVLAIMMVCRVGLAILLALGPLFIVAILFEKTKSLFDSWINVVITLVLTLVFLSLTVFLLFPILLKTIAVYFLYSEVQGGVLNLKQSYQLMVILAVYIAVIRQVPSTAASIARGYATNISGRWDQWDPGSRGAGGARQNPGELARQAGQ